VAAAAGVVVAAGAGVVVVVVFPSSLFIASRTRATNRTLPYFNVVVLQYPVLT